MTFTLVSSESSDWYVIPVDKVEEWWESWHGCEDLPDWAVYVQDPGHVEFDEYRCTL